MYEPINGWMLLVLYIVDNLLHFKEICTRMPRVRHTHTLLLRLYNFLRLSEFMSWSMLQHILEPDTSQSTLQSFLEEDKGVENKHWKQTHL